MSHASHANAALTPRARLRLARLVVEDGWPIPRAAERFEVAWRTAKKWADRYREEGSAGMFDRSSRPRRQPNRTPTSLSIAFVSLKRFIYRPQAKMLQSWSFRQFYTLKEDLC